MSNQPTHLIRVNDLSHSFTLGNNQFDVLKDINFQIPKGDFVSLLGKSGSGKSTLLNLIGGLMKPTKGNIFIEEQEISTLSENELAHMRKNYLGFVFQSYNLIQTLNTFENIEMPLVFSGLDRKERQIRVNEVLDIVGLSTHAQHMPNELSGGQQQRVSIARALVNKPKLVLADEPTGNLDTSTEEEIIAFMKNLNQDHNITFIIVTHDVQVANNSKRVISLKDGALVSDRNSGTDDSLLLGNTYQVGGVKA